MEYIEVLLLSSEFSSIFFPFLSLKNSQKLDCAPYPVLKVNIDAKISLSLENLGWCKILNGKLTSWSSSFWPYKIFVPLNLLAVEICCHANFSL